MTQQVSILIPHYKTLELTKLCLRCLKKYSDLNQVKVIVIDNGSKDDSSQYLRSLNWIELIEREVSPQESPPQAHANALDLALERVDTPYVLSIHTDTIICHPQWLDFLLSQINQSAKIAGVGSWKLEHKPWIRRMAKKLERFWQLYIWYPITRQGEGLIEGRGKSYYYLRSHCALYRTDLVRAHTKGFHDGQETAGKVMHKKLVDSGFEMLFLESEQLTKYLRHLNHATMILNPEISGKRTGTKRAQRRILHELNSVDYQKVLADDSLDN